MGQQVPPTTSSPSTSPLTWLPSPFDLSGPEHSPQAGHQGSNPPDTVTRRIPITKTKRVIFKKQEQFLAFPVAETFIQKSIIVKYLLQNLPAPPKELCNYIPLIRNMHYDHTFSFLKVIFLIRTWTITICNTKDRGHIYCIF